jgi:hypothetical protein
MKRSFAGLLALAAFLCMSIRANAAPFAQSSTAWMASYFKNPNLQGEPAFTRSDPTIDFTWGTASPDPNLPAGGFSVRWTRWVSIDTAGNWTLTTINNDGVRLFVDDALVMDSWTDQPATAHTAVVNLTQAFHLVRLEYYHHAGKAQAHLQLISASFPDWRGEYYANSGLTGSPAFVRDDSTVNFNFGTAGPGGGVPGDNFSVRWTRALYFNAGRYRFSTLTDDGARLWVDNQLLIDQWHDQVPTTWTGDVTLTAGHHLVKMEYLNHLGAGLAVLSWIPVPGSTEIWHGDYFDNAGLTGSAALSRDDVSLNFSWGTAAPGKGISDGLNWSARFTSKRVASLAGYYTVNASADDGVRIWVDNNLVIDQWHDSSPTTYAGTVYLNAGSHDWRVEYYQHQGAASLLVQIINGVTSPSLGETTPPATGEVIVDEQATGCFKSGSAGNWRDYPAGYANHAWWTQNSTFSQSQSNWVRWYPRLPRPGLYEVAVYIPGNVATTRNARYWISHIGTSEMYTVNQSLYTNQWVSLGTYRFSAMGDEYVALADATYEPATSTAIVFDAVRFTPR